LSLKSIS